MIPNREYVRFPPDLTPRGRPVRIARFPERAAHRFTARRSAARYVLAAAPSAPDMAWEAATCIT